MKIKISEIFCSVQGEGITVGKPSVFLRTSLCNLSCSWCDTKYTWDWYNYDYYKEVKEIDIDDAYKKILELGTSRLVVTGGEPMLQQKQLLPLLKLLKKDSYFIEFETNGTIVPMKETAELVDQWNVSPKLSSANYPMGVTEIDYCYDYFNNASNAYFKFVIGDINDIHELEFVIRKHGISSNKIILMPQAATKKELTDRSKWLYRIAKKNGYRYSTRLQVLLWENKRGK